MILRNRAFGTRLALASLTAAAILGCVHRPAARATPDLAPTQLVVVTTAHWDSTAGVLRRFTRQAAGGSWAADGPAIPVVVGRTGLAWDPALEADAAAGDPRKREGDGRSPAGRFPLDTVFGFAPRDSVGWVRLPYVALSPTADCVDDTASAHYNTVVDRATVARVDWTSAEHMREVAQYRLGVIVGYNAAPPRHGRGSCIFLHIWNGSGSTTAGCTAFDAGELTRLVAWLDPARHPMLVQLPAQEYERMRRTWGLP
jgi:D-alanyl-D-alanine dipeptidase